MSADDRLYALRDPCKNRSEDKGDICKDSVGGNTCISVQLKDQEIEYDNNDSRGKLQYKSCLLYTLTLPTKRIV